MIEGRGREGEGDCRSMPNLEHLKIRKAPGTHTLLVSPPLVAVRPPGKRSPDASHVVTAGTWYRHSRSVYSSIDGDFAIVSRGNRE